MAQDQTKKEALFNEVKGSLFEYLVARELAVLNNGELDFQHSLDRNYLAVLTQQDRMVRQFYPEMLPFLNSASKLAANSLVKYLKVVPTSPKVVGKFSNSVSLSSELHEADLILSVNNKSLPVSLKLNKKNAFVNTKSGGIKSFFSLYFPFIARTVQESFNQFVDMEFNRMAFELHAIHDLEYKGNFKDWVSKGLSELPGELDSDSRAVLKAYYARIAEEMHSILKKAQESDHKAFRNSLPTLMGFSSKEILQLIYFHDFPLNLDPGVDIHSYRDVEDELFHAKLSDFGGISSVELDIGSWALQIRVKPMNKFTTTAIKINCSIRTARL
jgi:hypothetical protein